MNTRIINMIIEDKYSDVEKFKSLISNAITNMCDDGVVIEVLINEEDMGSSGYHGLFELNDNYELEVDIVSEHEIEEYTIEIVNRMNKVANKLNKILKVPKKYKLQYVFNWKEFVLKLIRRK
jgi:hypothetical protein